MSIEWEFSVFSGTSRFQPWDSPDDALIESCLTRIQSIFINFVTNSFWFCKSRSFPTTRRRYSSNIDTAESKSTHQSNVYLMKRTLSAWFWRNFRFLLPTSIFRCGRSLCKSFFLFLWKKNQDKIFLSLFSPQQNTNTREFGEFQWWSLVNIVFGWLWLHTQRSTHMDNLIYLFCQQNITFTVK